MSAARPSDSDRSRRRARRLRVAGALLGLGLVLGAATWWAIERALDVNRYRGLVEGEIERWTGLEASVGRLDLALRPVPVLSLLDVSLGDEEVSARVERIDLRPRLRELLRRRLDLARIELDGLELVLPAEAERARTRWTELSERVSAQADALALELEGGGGAWPGLMVDGVDTDRLDAEDVRIHLGSPDATPLRVSVWLSDLAEERITVQATAELAPETALGLGGSWTGEARFGRGAGDEPGAEADLVFLAERAGIRVSGTAHLPAESDVRAGAELRIDALELDREALADAIATFELAPLRIEPDPDAGLSLRDAVVGFGDDGGPQLRAGQLHAHGLGASWQERAWPAPFALEARFEHGAVDVVSLAAGESLDLSGRLAYDPTWQRLELGARGTLPLAALLRVLALETGVAPPPDDLRVALGELSAGFAAPTWEPELGLLRAQIATGTWPVTIGELPDVVRALELELAPDGGDLRASVRARSDALGELAGFARLPGDDERPSGRLALDARKLLAFAPDDAQVRDAIAPILGAYARSELSWEWQPESAATGWAVELSRAGAPAFRGRFAAPPGPADPTQIGVDVRAELPLAALSPLLPDVLDASGPVGLQLRRAPGAARFELDTDLRRARLRWEPLLEKPAGSPLQLRLRGDVGAEGWSLRGGELVGPGSPVVFEQKAGRILVPELDLDLARWNGWLSDEASFAGQVRGSLATNPLEGRLRFGEARARLNPKLALERVDGEIEFGPDGTRVRALALRTTGTDLRLDGEMSGDRFSGRLAGPSLDVNRARAWLDALDETLSPHTAPASTGRVRNGDVEVRLDRVIAGRSQARELRARVELRDDDVHVRDLALKTYEGTIEGAVDLVGRPGEPSRLALRIDAEGITGRFLDDFLFEEPRDIHGVITARLEFDAPLLDDVPAMLAVGDGLLTWSERDGSFGKLGFASRIATALRATEVLRGQLPTLRDEGLVFDTLEARLALKRGRMTIERFEVDAKAYALSGSGWLDFAADASQLDIDVYAIKGFVPYLDRIPIANEALKVVNVRVEGSGSPYDLAFKVGSWRSQFVALSQRGLSAIRRVRDAARLLRPGNGTPEPPSPEAPSPEPQSPEAPAEPGAQSPSTP